MKPRRRVHRMNHVRWHRGLLFVVLMAAGGMMLSAAPVTQRASVDRPDDVSGNQIHVMYVLPSDGVDQQLDINGTIATSVAAFQKWLAGQTRGQRLRLDTYQRTLNITFFRLSRSDAQISSFGAFVRDQ